MGGEHHIKFFRSGGAQAVVIPAEYEMTGAVDLSLAAHARSLGLTLVTNNLREFCRVEGLKVENWLEEHGP